MIPKTCNEAASCFRLWAARTPFREEYKVLMAQVYILEMFGDQPVPAKLFDKYDFK